MDGVEAAGVPGAGGEAVGEVALNGGSCNADLALSSTESIDALRGFENFFGNMLALARYPDLDDRNVNATFGLLRASIAALMSLTVGAVDIHSSSQG